MLGMAVRVLLLPWVLQGAGLSPEAMRLGPGGYVLGHGTGQFLPLWAMSWGQRAGSILGGRLQPGAHFLCLDQVGLATTENKQ